MSVIPIETLSETIREPIGSYARHVQQLAGSKLLGLTVFGAAITSAFQPDRHRVRNVIVLDQFDLNFMRQLAGYGARYGKLHVAAPLVMTPRFIEQSRDTFALELLEIQEQHRTVLGQDHFAELSLGREHVRLQCERELKIFQVGMHQGLLASMADDRYISELVLDIADGLLRVLGGLLWLSGESPRNSASQIIDQTEHRLHRQLPGLEAVLLATDQLGWPQFQQLYRDVEALEQSIHGG
jgi:hypothetical protein